MSIRPYRIQTALPALLSIALFPTQNMADSHHLPHLVVAASRVEQPIDQVGSTVISLPLEELRNRGVEFVADALRELPSLVLTSQGPRGSLTQIRARGNEANHMLVLIDGVRVSNASTGEYDFANLNLESIERIEVLLGPQSMLYGSDAIAGVISITTASGDPGMQRALKLGIGSDNSRSATAQFSGAEGDWHYHLSAKRYLTDGISAASEENGNSEKDAYAASTLNLKAGYRTEQIKTQISYNQEAAGYDFDSDDFMTGMAIDAPDNRQWSDNRSLAWSISAPLLDQRLNNRLQVSRTEQALEIYSVFFGFGSTYETETDRSTFEYQGDYRLSDSNRLQFGAEYFKDELSTAGFTRFDDDVLQRGHYLQWLTRVNTLDISLGSRWDNHQAFGTHHTYRITASLPVSPRLRLRASHGTGFKAPSLQELYDTGFGGNDQLKPEESKSTELGLTYQQDNLSLDLTLYDQSITHLIRYTGFYPSGQNINIDSAESRGAELSLGLDWDNFSIDTAMARIDATETRQAQTSQRIRVPEWSANLLATYQRPWGSLWAQANYKDERRDINFATGQDVMLASYWLFNLGIHYEMSDECSISARIDNLTDEYYEEVFSYGTPGRTAMVNLDWRF